MGCGCQILQETPQNLSFLSIDLHMVRATKIFSVMEASWMPIKTFLKKHVTKGVINEQHAKSMYLKQNSLQNHVRCNNIDNSGHLGEYKQIQVKRTSRFSIYREKALCKKYVALVMKIRYVFRDYVAIPLVLVENLHMEKYIIGNLSRC